MPVNLPLLRRLRTRFLRMKHEKHFEMSVVAVKTDCGSQMCIAGHTLDLAGYKRKLLPSYERNTVMDYIYFTPSGEEVQEPLVAAADELGIGGYRRAPDSVAFVLFHDSSLTTPRDAAERIGELIEEYQQ